MRWHRRPSEPTRLALTYAALAGGIIAADLLVQRASGGPPPSIWYLARCIGFVGGTGVAMHWLAGRMRDRLQEADNVRQADLRLAKARLKRAKGMQAALARANQAALTATEENSLCREISEAMVDLGGLRLVWFAWVDETTRQVVPVNWAGDAHDYLVNFRCSVDENDPHGRGPTGSSIRQSSPIVCNDMLAEPSLGPWMEKIQRHGFRSCIAMPLRLRDRRGAISAYADEPDFFDEEIIGLTKRLAADLELGLGLIATRAEHARTDRHLHENEARHRALFDSHHVAMLIVDPRAGVVADATPAAARVLGVSLAKLKNQSLRATSFWKNHGLFDAAERAIRQDRPEAVESTISAPDGRLRQIAATFIPFPFREDVRLFCTLEDITEKNRAVERLRLMQVAIEAAPSGIVIADALGRIEWVNPAFTAMTGYELKDVAGRNPRILKSGRQGPRFYKHLWNTISRGKVWEGDLQNLRRDGAIYWEHMVIAPVVRPNGTIEHYVAIKQDISAQKEMESQVARTQRLESIGLLAGGIAHDLNNVLAPILMAMDLFKLRYTDPADQARFEMVRKSAERGAGIVRQVLTFARGVGGERMSLRPAHIVKEVRNLLQETLPRNIEIEFNLSEHLPCIVGDPTQLHQVLLNLCVNARDAMPQGGVLTITAGRLSCPEQSITRSGLVLQPGDYVSICVRDTGTGIPPEILERVFEPFFTTKPRGAGTGLGLSTVLGIIRGHGGGLEVESDPGSGTAMSVILPVDVNATPTALHSERPANLSGDGRIILVVDDEEAIRAVTGMALDLQGFIHVDATDGREALDIFERDPERFAAVILDQMMPRMAGDEVARRMKERRPDLPIILISGLLVDSEAGEKAHEPAARHGDVVLRKPFAQVDLLDALARVLK